MTNDSQAKVSVIIPVYNAEKYLRECLDSVLAQSLREIEIICVDDGSTDNSLAILREYAGGNSKIRVFTQANARQGAARNRALDQVRGEYIAFLDADDAFAPGALEKLYRNATDARLEMLLFSCVRVSPSGRELRWSYHHFAKFLPLGFPYQCFSWKDCSPELFWRMPCSCWGTFYSRAFLEEHKLRFPEKIFFEDRPFFFFALTKAKRVGIIDEALYRYTENPDSTIASKGKHLADNIEQGCMILRKMREERFPQELIREGVVAHVHDLLKSLGISPKEVVVACKQQLIDAFEELFPPRERNEFIESLITERERACTRIILGEASFIDKWSTWFSGVKYSIFKYFVRGERRERYFEKEKIFRKILSVKCGETLSALKVSVIIPCYNAEKYLQECLDSVVSQTLKEIEIICVDDGSTDSTLRILEEYAAKDSRIRVLRQQNRFAGVARNNGMKIARGKYLCFLDADDVFHLEMLEKSVARAEKYSAEIVIWGGYTFTEKLSNAKTSKEILKFSRLPWTRLFPPLKIARRLFQVGWGVPWNKLFLRSFIEENRLRFSETRSSNDIYFVFAAMAVAKKIVSLKQHLVYYRRAGKGKSLQESFEKSPTDFIVTQTQLSRFLQERTKGEFELSFLKMLICNSLWYLKRANPVSREQIKTELLKHVPVLADELPEAIRSRLTKSERETYEELRKLLQ